MNLMVKTCRSACIIPVLFLIIGGLCAPSRAEEPAVVVGIRTLGMGGASVAAVNDEELFFSNPAALGYIENSVFSSFDLKSGFSHESIRFLSRLYRYNSDSTLLDLTKTRVRNLDVLEPLYKLSGPLNVTYIRQHFGFGLFETLDLTFNPMYYPVSRQSSIRVSAQQTTLGMISFADYIELPPRPSRISIGGTLKYIVRAEVDRQDAVEMMDHGVTAEIGEGFGLDIGALYKIRERYAVGLMIRDALTSQFVWKYRLAAGSIKKKESPKETKIRPCAAVGISFTPDWELPYVLQDVILALDLDRMYQPEIGAEVTLYRFLKLRTGVSDDGIAFGFGFKADVFALDYAFVSQLKDEFAGDIDNPSHFVNFAFRF